MDETDDMPDRGEEASVAVRPDDEPAFAALFERHRRELQVHCYRMLGSLEEAEDLVQETFLRAWRKRDSFQGRSTFRAWLYRIATNACLDFLDRHPRQPRPYAGREPGVTPPPNVHWLQPYPDHLLDSVAPDDSEPGAAVVAKETIEIAFLTAIQHLPPRQRAVLILRDVLGWPSAETAQLLDTSVASVKSALQRARPAMKEHLPPRRLEWAPSADPTREERALLQRYMDAHERANDAAIAELLREDVKLTMPPHPMWFTGRAAIIDFTRQVFDQASPHYHGQWRGVPTRANRQPAVASYVRRPGDERFRAQVLDVLRIEEGRIAEITAFVPELFPSFALPLTLPAEP